MSCCSPKKNEKNDEKFSCPKCQDKGMSVKLLTVQSLLKEEFKKEVNPDFSYRFCKSSDCKVVYFSLHQDHIFTKEQLSTKVTLKDPGLNVNVCYCFDHTRQSVLDELKSKGESSVLEDVKSKMKDPGCFCETSNPQGNCCLGNISAWVKEAKEAYT